MQIRKNNFQNLKGNFPTCHQSYVGHEFPPYLPLDSNITKYIYKKKLFIIILYKLKGFLQCRVKH